MIESKTKEIYVGAAMICIALLGAFVVIPAGIDLPSSVQFRALSPDFWPHIIMGMLGACGILVLVQAYLERKALVANGAAHQGEADDNGLVEHAFKTRVLRSVFGMACLFAFYVGIKHLGVVASSVIVVLVLTTALGQRDWKRVVPLAVILPVFLYYFFVYVAQVPMPQGIFESLM